MTSLIDLSKAVVASLRELYPEISVIDAEESGAAPPSTGAYMEVRLLSGSRHPLLGGRYRQTAALLISCRAAQGASTSTAAEAIALLLASVRLPDGSTVRGGDIQHEWADGMLHVKASFACSGMIPQDSGVIMNHLIEEVEPIGPTK